MKTESKFYYITPPFHRLILMTLILLNLLFALGCNKFVEVDELKDQMLSSEVFNNENSANAAILSLYTIANYSQISGTINGFGGMLADDMIFQYNVPNFKDYESNTVQSNNPYLPWASLYEMIYNANSAIEGLQMSKGIGEGKRTQFLSEAKFWRAYAYFYLVNFFGDVPLLTSTDVEANALASRTPTSQIYDQMIDDLIYAQGSLHGDYSLSEGKKVRVNKWAATAMLARVYLYKRNWEAAEKQATVVINESSCKLLDSPAGIFASNNQEAILQLDRYPGHQFIVSNYLIPGPNMSTPYIVCKPSLLNEFENGDQRRNLWFSNVMFSGNEYQAAFKFTQKDVNIVTELETPLRLAEQYLIRSEARAMRNDFTGAIADINMIRLKHGALTSPLPVPLREVDALNIILHERRVELFAEGAHRWLDLKRTDKVDLIMQSVKPTTWKKTAILLPIPISDVQRNSNLKQNPGYQ